VRKSNKDISKYFSLRNILIGAIVFLVAFLALVFVRKTLLKKDIAPITKDQIMIQRGGNTVIVNRNGLIEYRSGDRVFYRNWDSDRISSFFDFMEEKARAYLANPPPGECAGYKVTLYLDDELVEICVDEDDIDLGEILEELYDYFGDDDDNDGDDGISDYFDDDDDDGTTGVPTPTLPPGITPTATPTPSGNEYSPEDNYPPVEASCATWSESIFGKAIISNTLCVEEE
jgi:hypothetical protein